MIEFIKVSGLAGILCLLATVVLLVIGITVVCASKSRKSLAVFCIISLLPLLIGFLGTAAGYSQIAKAGKVIESPEPAVMERDREMARYPAYLGLGCTGLLWMIALTGLAGNRSVVSLLLAGVIPVGCSERTPGNSSANQQLQELARAIGCTIVDPGSTFPLETRDREFYNPLSFAIANIHTKEALDGYHGPTVGKYILSIETYPTESEARKRAEEYRDLSRLAGVTSHDEHELSKMTVRCWGYSSGNRAYLLTTQAAMFSALEDRTSFVSNGVKAFEERELALRSTSPTTD